MAIAAGQLGLHKFILGKSNVGLTMLLVSLLTCGIGAIVMRIIAIIEGVKYLKMSDAEFYGTYVVGDKTWL